MPRPLRIEYEGALYHVTSRGDRREAIFLDDRDRIEFLHTFEQATLKTGWQTHAYSLMSNHFHLVLETPQPNLALGMKWFLGTYTQRFNRRHGQWGHLFGGRYRAQIIDGRSPGYLRRACDYVHLNPSRAGLIAAEDKLESYKWSSYPAYRHPRLRPTWLRVERLLGEHGLITDTVKSRREFERIMEQGRLDPQDTILVKRSWIIGAEDFRDWLAEKLARRGRDGERAAERSETDTALAERLVREALAQVRWREIDLAMQPKGHPLKIDIARQLRAQTPMTRHWIADRLRMGSASYVSKLLGSVDYELRPLPGRTPTRPEVRLDRCRRALLGHISVFSFESSANLIRLARITWPSERLDRPQINLYLETRMKISAGGASGGQE